ncbi:MAG: hypothetical protein J6U54_17845 [Clostridiales bacterium]|nr:hypothetical protein [Clostridiales bacterium]
MASTKDSGLCNGTRGSPQKSIDEEKYVSKQKENEANSKHEPQYKPTQKHQPGHNWGSENPIRTQEEGQKLLENGYEDGKQVYNITDDGIIVKFQPDNTPENGYHAYKVSSPRDVPSSILKRMLIDGKITRAEYNKFRKGKKDE